jgi:hypothetical protein
MGFKAVLAATVLGSGGVLSAAHADTVLYDSAGFIQGQQAFVQSFDITTAGTMTVTLSNIPWMDTIADLGGFMSTSSGVINGSVMNAGTETFNVLPGVVYAHWFGDANGKYGIGVYGLDITYAANQAVTPVPLPASLVLLLSGIGLICGWQRRIAPDPKTGLTVPTRSNRMTNR